MKKLLPGALRTAVLTALTLGASPSFAGKLVIGCSLIKDYSELQVNLMLNQARLAVGETEATRLHGKYVSLRSECQNNVSASRVVQVSPALTAWLTQSGVDLRKLQSAER
jgi:hypothetical protein